MDLITYLEDMQARHMDVYVASYEELVASHNAVFPEIIFEISGTTYRRLFATDFIVREPSGNQVVELGTHPHSISEPRSFLHNGIRVSFEAVSWDAIQINAGPTKIEPDAFDRWFDYWLDLDASRKLPDAIFGDVIHSVAISEAVYSVDFGSAPPDAFIELLDLFAASGATSLDIRDDKR